jgi:hypothetical protein
MRKHLFKWSLIFYFIGVVYLCGSLSVPPADLPVFLVMDVLAVCAVIGSKEQIRRWKTISIILLIIVVLGTILQIIGGHIIKTRRDRDRNISGQRESEQVKSFPRHIEC